MKLRLCVLLVPALLAAGCGPLEDAPEPVVDELTGQVLQEATTKYDMHRLLEDSDVTGGQAITPANVQAFLQQQGSYLAGYTDPAYGKTAATLIVERSRASNISPLYMLARIQGESSLIQSGTSTNLSKATGCGCPDSSGCDAQYVGFGKQVECAAKKMRGYLTDLETSGTTVSGWKVGVTKSTLDPCSVKPANKVTAALYTYTPWVGAYAIQCGRTTVGGSSLMASIYNRYATAYPWPSSTPAGCYSGTVDATVPEASCVQSSSDALWRQCLSGVFTAGSTAKPTNCNVSFPYCQSTRLGRGVATRTCVQASSTLWQQCGAEGVWRDAPGAGTSGVGPMGACYQVYAL
ncbi:hypothetical protein [Corallococcus llansteffanensis]|uniref:Lipoprotein n=1 Tax=Corallococcus llansteffanensis TaxID=2316731 RepID=A0A3A8NB02_9BACT|nr:hypothetical protein [Corallococcus llansteffanensis]RKH37152.1 hypothetical protein D7V93_42345 [Corallococcus llansteffanensis]